MQNIAMTGRWSAPAYQILAAQFALDDCLKFRAASDICTEFFDHFCP
jgi:hypothetical protein